MNSKKLNLRNFDINDEKYNREPIMLWYESKCIETFYYNVKIPIDKPFAPTIISTLNDVICPIIIPKRNCCFIPMSLIDYNGKTITNSHSVLLLWNCKQKHVYIYDPYGAASITQLKIFYKLYPKMKFDIVKIGKDYTNNSGLCDIMVIYIIDRFLKPNYFNYDSDDDLYKKIKDELCCDIITCTRKLYNFIYPKLIIVNDKCK